MNSLSRTIFYLVMVGCFVLYIETDGRINPLYSAIHFGIIALSLIHIARARRFDLGLSYSFFALFFFGVIPLFEYRLDITYNGMTTPRDSSYMTAAGLAFLSSIFFYLGYGLRRGTKPDPGSLQPVSYVNRRHYRIVWLVSAFAIVALAIFIAAYYGFDPASIAFRGVGEQIESSAFGYSLVNYFIRPLLFNLVFLIILIHCRRASRPDLGAYALLLFLMVFVSPIGIPRSLAGALYIPLLTTAFFPRLSSKYAVICIVIFGVLFAAPLFDVFRTIQFKDEVDLGENYSLDYLFSGHFDAFFNFAEVIELHYSSAGLQVIGALLFWVPRIIWPDKPVGTSFDFGEFAGFRSHNVSFPLCADLYVDFGVFGVILGMYFLGIIYRRLDNYFSRPRAPGSVSAYVFAAAHMELAILGIYLLRGNFLSSFSFTVGVASTLMLLVWVNGIIRGSQGIRARRHAAIEA